MYNSPLPCAPRIEGACLQGMVGPCPLRISSSCKEEVISKVNSTSPFASWRRLVLEALDDRKHVDMAKQESVHMPLRVILEFLRIFYSYLLLIGKCRLCLIIPPAFVQKQHSQPLHKLFVEYLLPSRQRTAYLSGPKGYTADAQKPQNTQPVVMVESHSKTNINLDLGGDIVVSTIL